MVNYKSLQALAGGLSGVLPGQSLHDAAPVGGQRDLTLPGGEAGGFGDEGLQLLSGYRHGAVILFLTNA